MAAFLRAAGFGSARVKGASDLSGSRLHRWPLSCGEWSSRDPVGLGKGLRCESGLEAVT